MVRAPPMPLQLLCMRSKILGMEILVIVSYSKAVTKIGEMKNHQQTCSQPENNRVSHMAGNPPLYLMDKLEGNGFLIEICWLQREQIA